jgi:predicted O-methyltransferase YrrM
MPDRDISERLNDYLTGLVPPRPPELVRMEQYAKEHGFPIIGPICGHFCYQLARMIGAQRIFELGSGYGYSTAWFARAVAENGGGEVHHVVWDNKLSGMARKHLTALGFNDIIQYHNAEAVETLRQTAGPFDLIFNDIDKAGYPASLPVIKEKLRSGGLVIIDNMIWHGEIFDPDNHTPDAQGVREITRLLTTDPGWISSVVPLRDGLMIARKA